MTTPTTPTTPTAPMAPTAAETPGASLRRELRRFGRSGQVRWGLVLLFLTTITAFGGPFLAAHDPTLVVGLPYAAPAEGTPLGTDQLGRDVLSRVLAGGVHLAWMAPVAAVASVAVGALVGLVAAFGSSRVDAMLTAVLDVLLAFPALLFALLFVAMLGPAPWLLVTLVALALVPGVARVVRGAAKPLTGREYVLWARAVGIPGRSILWREVLPNVTSPLLVELGVRLMWAVGILASMSFIGYGIQPPTPDWGLMVSENRTGLAPQPLAVLAPIVLIVLYTVGGNLVAEGAARVIARTEGTR